jgi:hypothetical protein
MVLAVSLLLLAAAPDAGAVAVIWGGGKDATAAHESLARWEAEKRLLGELVTFAPGFPKMVSSTTVPGLNPGFHIVLLGFCSREEGQSERAYLQALYPFTYEKPVKDVESACPVWVEPSKERAVESRRTVKGVRFTLSVVVLARPELPDIGEVPPEGVPARWLSVVARDGAGALLGVYSLKDQRYYFGGDRTVGCETAVKSVRKDVVVLERHCTGSSGACTSDPGERKRVTVRWNGKAFIPEEKLLEKWSGVNCAE